MLHFMISDANLSINDVEKTCISVERLKESVNGNKQSVLLQPEFKADTSMLSYYDLDKHSA